MSENKEKKRLLDLLPRGGVYGGVDHRDWKWRSGVKPEKYKNPITDRKEWEEKYEQIFKHDGNKSGE